MKHVEYFDPGTIRVTWNPFHVLSNSQINIQNPQDNVLYTIYLFKCTGDTYDCRDDSNAQQVIAEVSVEQSSQSLLKNGNQYTYVISDYSSGMRPTDYVFAKVYSNNRKFNKIFNDNVVELEVVDVQFSSDSSEQVGYQELNQSCESDVDCDDRL